MSNFYQNLPPELSIELQQLAKLMYDTRESRRGLLAQYGVEGEAAMLARIAAGELPSLPAYDDYLSARLLDQTSQAARARMAQLAGQPHAEVPEPLHLQLAEQAQQHFADQLDSAPVLLQNALQLVLDNGVDMEIRYADAEHYALIWSWGEGVLRIDTAPGERTSRLVRDDGSVHADALTAPGGEPWSNLQAVLAAVLGDPLLG